MSKFRENNIAVSGDGNAVGDNNHLTVIKHERHNHHHTPPRSSDGGGGGAKEDASPVVFGLGFAMIAVCVVGSYFFALHAQAVYNILQLILGVELVAALWLMYQTFDDEGTLSPKLMVMSILFTLVSAALVAARANYRDELTAIAQASKSATQFWCSMNDYGRELSLLHLVTSVIGFGLGSLLLAAPTGAIFAARVFVGPADGKGWSVIERLSSWGVIVFGAVLVLGAAYLHTDSGWDTWSSIFGNPPSFFCKNVAAVSP